MKDYELESRKCVPCRGGVPPIESDRANELLAAIPGWLLSADARRLSLTVTFADFAHAMKFVNSVAEIAEDQGHHPDFAIHWNRVELLLYTHKIDGLHENDFVMAARINKLVESPL